MSLAKKFQEFAKRSTKKIGQLMVSSGSIFKKNNPNHYYGYDLWKEIAEKLEPFIPEGIPLYGEAVGYLNTGAPIQAVKQGPYHYGQAPGTYGLYIYRITFTNPNGDCFDFTWQQIKDFCEKYGLNHVKEYFYGKAKDIYPELSIDDHWHENMLTNLLADPDIGMGDIMCPYNEGKVPSEGIVLKIDSLYEDKVFKLKNAEFLIKESATLDEGNANIEDNQEDNQGE